MSRPGSFSSPEFKIRVNRWPVLTAHKVIRAFGDEAIRLIQARAAAGKQADGSPLPAYSTVYAQGLRKTGEGTRRDLKLSGELMRSLKRLGVRPVIRPTTVKIGWDARSRSPNVVRTSGGTHIGNGAGQRHRAIVQRLSRGQGATQPRKILGITQADHRRLGQWLKKRSSSLLTKK